MKKPLSLIGHIKRRDFEMGVLNTNTKRASELDSIGIDDITSSCILMVHDGTGLKKVTVSDLINALGAGATPGHLRHKFLGTSITSEQLDNIDNGTFYDMQVGDFWTINSVDYYIIDINYYLHTGDTEFTKNHLLMKPRTALYTYKWNDSNTTANGYKGSKIRQSGLTNARTTIKAAFGSNNILSHRIYITNAVTNGYPSGGEWVDSDVELPTEELIYGCSQFHAGVYLGTTIPTIYRIEKSQAALYALDKEFMNERYHEWTRDIVSAAYAARRGGIGLSYGNSASSEYGVSPVFCLGKGSVAT